MRFTPKAITTALVLLILVGNVRETSAMSPNFASANQVRECQLTDVKITVATSRLSYAVGTPVKMFATILNVSSKACSAAIGGTSPSLKITKAKGVVVWDNCYSNDQPGACAQYLVLRTLNPGAKFSTTRTWSQHISGRIASRGIYMFEVSFAGSTIKKAIKFKLVK